MEQNSKLEVIPSILTNNRAELEEMLLKSEGAVKRAQIDIIDGEFAENKTVDPAIVKEIDTSLLLDFHLMTKEPINWVEKSKTGGGDRIIGQIEMMGNQEEFVGKVEELGALVGLGIDLETPVNSLDQELIPRLDVILVMSVKAGFGGQKFQESALKKIKELSDLKQKRGKFHICVDGGVSKENLSKIKGAGADEVSIGRRIFAPTVADGMKQIEGLL